jgi:hypothetical protein
MIQSGLVFQVGNTMGWNNFPRPILCGSGEKIYDHGQGSRFTLPIPRILNNPQSGSAMCQSWNRSHSLKTRSEVWCLPLISVTLATWLAWRTQGEPPKDYQHSSRSEGVSSLKNYKTVYKSTSSFWINSSVLWGFQNITTAWYYHKSA